MEPPWDDEEIQRRKGEGHKRVLKRIRHDRRKGTDTSFRLFEGNWKEEGKTTTHCLRSCDKRQVCSVRRDLYT